MYNIVPQSFSHGKVPSTPGIYTIVNLVNQHFYVGSSSNLAKRKRQHFRNLQKGSHHSVYLQRAYNQYGADMFVFIIIEHVEYVDNLLKREQHYIDLLSPHYNIARTAGSSNLGMRFTDEHKAKISESVSLAVRGKKRSPHTPERSANISAAKKGKKQTPEHIANARAPKLGKKQTPGHIENRAATRRGKKQSPEFVKKRMDARRANSEKRKLEQQAGQSPLF